MDLYLDVFVFVFFLVQSIVELLGCALGCNFTSSSEHLTGGGFGEIGNFTARIVNVFVNFSSNFVQFSIDLIFILQEERPQDLFVDNGSTIVWDGPHAPKQEEALEEVVHGDPEQDEVGEVLQDVEGAVHNPVG